MVDRLLRGRVHQLAIDLRSRDSETVVNALRSKFPGYARKKTLFLKREVEEYFKETRPRENETVGGAVRSTDIPVREDVEEEKVEKENMNSQLHSLYKKTTSDTKKRRLPSPVQEKFEPEERPELRLSDMGGIDGVLYDINQLVLYPLTHPEIFTHLGVLPPTGVLLHGAPGSGKTMLAHAIAGSCGVPFFKIAAPEIIEGVSGESEAKLRNLFQAVVEAAPSLLFLDEIDCIAPKREHAERQMDRRIVAQLLKCLDDLQGKPVVVLGATNSADSIDSSLRRSGRFDREIAMGIPDLKARIRILEVITKDMRLSPDIRFDDLALLTPGYVGADLSSLTKEAAMSVVRRTFTRLNSSQVEAFTDQDLADIYVGMDDFREAVKKVQPSSKREGFSTVPDVTWDSIGALSNLRREMELAICEPIQKAELYHSVGLTIPCGCLLYGPPGCGKTLLAKAVANASGANFISVKGPELLNKYVGESERAVRQVFERAQTSAPCVIFFDELDALVPKRSAEGNSSSERVVNQMLTEMDGMQTRRDVFVIGATNRPDILDPAMMRPGRLDRLLYVPLPSCDGRREILQTLTRKTPTDSSVDFGRLSESTSGFSGADLAGLTREATLIAISKATTIDGVNSVLVGMTEFEDALSKVGPSISDTQRDEYLQLSKRIRTR